MKNNKEKELIKAVYFNRKPIVLKLLSEGVNANYVDQTGFTAFETAIFYGRLDLALILISYIDIRQVNSFGSTALHLVASKGYNDILLILLAREGGNINHVDANGETALYRAVAKGHNGTVKLLLKHGASANAVAKIDGNLGLHGATPLHWAAILDNLKMIKLLVKNGANTEIRTKEGQTARDIFKTKHLDRIEEFDAIIAKAKARFEKNAMLKAEITGVKAAPVIDSSEKEGSIAEKESADVRLTKKEISILKSGKHNGLTGSSSLHHKFAFHAAHNGKKRKLSNEDYDGLKKTLVINEDEEEYADVSGGEENSFPSSSSSSSPASSLSLDSSKSESSSRPYPAEQPSDQQQLTEPNQYSLNTGQSANYEGKDSYIQGATGKVDSFTADNLLMTLFAWIKDLPKALQQQILSSFSMQQILKLLEKTIHPDKFITDQLNNQPVEEKFAEECQQYFGQDGFASNSQECAQVNQDNSPISLDKDVEVISSDGVLIDPLPKHDINFNMPHLFSSIAS